jgi:uncharacterized Zn finger protein (UPF0148 family)
MATYHLCPTCLRATPALAGELFCPNDGARMLVACPACATPLTSPYARYCSACGTQLVALAAQEPEQEREW